MRIRAVSVKSLFGVFDHEIPMDNLEGVTIIHGPNGFGKTVMLKMIAAAVSGDPTIFHSMPFKEFRLDFDDASAWILAPGPDSSGDDRQFNVTQIDRRGKATRQKPANSRDPSLGRILDLIDRSVPGPYSRAAGGWVGPDGRFYSLRQILSRFPRARAAVPRSMLARALGGEWKPIGIEVFVVEANRLVSTEGELRREPEHSDLHFEDPERVEGSMPRVEQYSADLIKRIKEVRSDYAKVTQARDSTFPERLVQYMRAGEPGLQESEIVSSLEQLDRKRQGLIALGFLDQEVALGAFKEADAQLARQALTIYAGDVKDKLSAFDDIAKRVGKLIEVIKARYEYKTLGIHRERGLVVTSENGNTIQLSDLSSGEQHELILLYELLFRMPSRGLILIDEPEISLHVAWQSRFLSDLIEILKLNGAYALVATHSPTLIGNQWNLTHELMGPKLNQAAEQG